MQESQQLLKIIPLKNGDTIYLLGTAHVSSQSVKDVRETAMQHNVDAIAIEIDSDRLTNMMDTKKWRELDINTILKRKQGFLLLSNLALSAFQKRIGKDNGVDPGSDMKEAVIVAKELDITPTLADRKVSITLRRVWRMSSFWQKMKLLASLFVGVKEDKVTEQDIENLKENDLLSQMMSELAKEFPSVKSVLIDERDTYLSYNIYHMPGKRRLAVVGAGHMNGILKWIDAMESGESVDITPLDVIPEPTLASKFSPYVISLVLVGILTYVLITQDNSGERVDVAFTWILANTIPAVIGAIIALAHPLTILVAGLVAPFTSFIPVLSAGLLAGITQATIRKPRAGDFEDIHEDFNKFKFYKNRVLQILLVFMLVNLGGFLGTILGLYKVVNKI
ncbi:TraB/GumN family protein [Entomospira nematocerorum]|uniref:TraB/GumN family protein n=1 Tax=Entomospira nematocerorum TaxID=2719987 RepID=A0A968GE53_9SPIO|nr:TraB/GumN family protein [Entomospira nematocera]NIZ46630.1 TraB/GumN family protein [Entomospira nematocera]WDI33572.1 TraB/GumN family protein [Entomospira nematocera]